MKVSRHNVVVEPVFQVFEIKMLIETSEEARFFRLLTANNLTIPEALLHGGYIEAEDVTSLSAFMQDICIAARTK